MDGIENTQEAATPTGGAVPFESPEQRFDFCEALSDQTGIPAPILSSLAGDSPESLLTSAGSFAEVWRKEVPLYPTVQQGGSVQSIGVDHKAALNSIKSDRERLQYIQQHMI